MKPEQTSSSNKAQALQLEWGTHSALLRDISQHIFCENSTGYLQNFLSSRIYLSGSIYAQYFASTNQFIFHCVNDAVPGKSIEEPTGPAAQQIPKYSCNF